MVEIVLRNVSKRFGARTVLAISQLQIASGECAAVVGPSGCGKSTLLRLLSGMLPASSGSIAFNGVDVTQSSHAKRGSVALMFQSLALFPYKTARDNIGYGLKTQQKSRETIKECVGRVAEKLRISHLLDRYPQTLSGGESQRVALARELVRNPDVLLVDEPLSQLDAQIRAELLDEIGRMHREYNMTLLYVTHDQAEAFAIADRVAVMREGSVQQCGTPDELLDRPATTFVAGFIGSPPMNLFAVQALSEPREIPAGVCTVGVPPKDLHLSDAGAPNSVVAKIVDVQREPASDQHLLSLDIDGGGSFRLAKAICRQGAKWGSTVHVSFDLRSAHFFDSAGKRIVTTGCKSV